MAAYLETRGFAYYSLSDVVRQEAANRGLDNSRENLVRVGNDLRQHGGPGILVQRLLARLQIPAVIDSVRNPGEAEALAHLERFVLLSVEAPAALRFQRIQARGRLGDIASLEEFRRFESRENSSSGVEQRIRATMAQADAVLVNGSSLEELRQRVDEALDCLGRQRDCLPPPSAS